MFRILFSLASLLVFIPYYLLTDLAARADGLTSQGSRRLEFGKPLSKFKPTLMATSILEQGQEISLNGRKFPVAWSQWNQNGAVRIGMSDTGAMQTLGLELLSTNNLALQPIHWFSSSSSQPISLQTQFINPYRYLDITEIIQSFGGQVQVLGDNLVVNFPKAQINNIRAGNQAWGKRIVVDLDRATVWQISQAKDEGVVTIDGMADSTLLKRFKPSSASSSGGNEDDDDPGSSSPSGNLNSNSQFFFLESDGKTTKLRVKLPTGQRLRVSSLSNPHRLIVDVRPDALVEKEIFWANGVTWHQQFVKLNAGFKSDSFPVIWLEINPRSPGVTLKPITSNPNTLKGIAPLVTTGRSVAASAAINSGFFNRNNQLPLGAIRRDSRWLSGPILNRGAIAWDNQGKVKIGRLSLRETLITSTGNRLPILLLNTGYIQAGMARYTQEWGSSYSPLSDNETIIIVQNDQVIQQLKAAKAGQNSFAIPSNGYLLAIRSSSVAPSAIPINTKVKLESNTIPADFANYSQILGAGPLLLQNGKIVLNASTENFSKAFQQQAASRSSIGITKQGTLILAAVHNRVGGRGATLKELAQIMQSLGAIDALNLDGGSSTSLYLGGQLIDRSPVTAARVHNGIGVFLSP